MVAFKTCLLGESGVGKTTISRMLQNKTLPVPRNPTIGVDIEKVNSRNGDLCIWDLAGQRRFQFMWPEFLKGASLSIFVTDSSPQNVEQTKELIERYQNKTSSKVIAIANKQDMAGRLHPSQIQQILGVDTYGMVGLDVANKNKLQQIIERNL